MIHAAKLFVLSGIIALALLGEANACQFDTDCEPGSRCLKASGSLYGVCVGGISPGNRNDRQPVYSPTDPNNTYGDTCTLIPASSTQIAVQAQFAKSGGIYGTCMRRRQRPA